MKLSKKNAALQRTMRKTIASGKTLGGLLVGIAATITGCREGNSPASTMGSYPNPFYHENGASESRSRRAIPGEPPVPQPDETNAVSECKNSGSNHTPGK
jgi:hypothetical protein